MLHVKFDYMFVVIPDNLSVLITATPTQVKAFTFAVLRQNYVAMER